MKHWTKIEGVLTGEEIEAITAKAGDLILMRGARSFHRGVTVEEDGRRVLVAYMYDEVGQKRHPLLNWIEERIARFVNY